MAAEYIIALIEGWLGGWLLQEGIGVGTACSEYDDQVRSDTVGVSQHPHPPHKIEANGWGSNTEALAVPGKTRCGIVSSETS